MVKLDSKDMNGLMVIENFNTYLITNDSKETTPQGYKWQTRSTLLILTELLVCKLDECKLPQPNVICILLVIVKWIEFYLSKRNEKKELYDQFI